MSLRAGPAGQGPTARPSKKTKRRVPSIAGGEDCSTAARIACALLVVLTLVAYSNTLRCPFVFDDKIDIVGNHSIRHLWPVWTVFLDDTTGQTLLRARPIVNLSFAINYATGALDPLHYHLTNLAIHVLAGLALFGIVRRTLRLPSLGDRYSGVAVPMAFVIAGLWALHPLQTQAVTFVTQRYESMMGLFYFVSLYCAIRSDSSARPRWWAVGAVAACLMAMGCKEVAVSAPLCILLYDRAFLAGSFGEAWKRRKGMYLGLAATWVALAVLLVFSFGTRSKWAGFGLPISAFEYATTQPGVILHYLRLSFWPHPQVFDYRWPIARTAAEIVPGALVVGGLLAATVWALVRRPKWGAIGAWFFLILAPTSSVLPIADAAFEHRMYLSLAAVVVVAAIVAYEMLQRLSIRFRNSSRASPWSRAAIAMAILGVSAAATYTRNRVYQSEWDVWHDAVQNAPDNVRAHNTLLLLSGQQGRFDEAETHLQKLLALDPPAAYAPNTLGLMLAQRGRVEQGIAQIRKALQIDPQLAMAHNNLALVLGTQGKSEEAIAHFRQACQCDPKYADAHYNLANLLQALGRSNEAAAEFEEALRINPHHAESHNNLGDLLRQQGNLDDAIAHFQKALWIDPQNVQARGNLASALSQQRRADEPLSHWRQVLKRDPTSAVAHYQLGRAFYLRGQSDAALRHWRESIRLQPDEVPLLNMLAWELATCPTESVRHGEEAVRLAERAVRLSGGQAPELLDTLGAAYAETGRFPDAVQAAQRALQLASRRGDAALAQALQKRLELYQSGSAFRDPASPLGRPSSKP